MVGRPRFAMLAAAFLAAAPLAAQQAPLESTNRDTSRAAVSSSAIALEQAPIASAMPTLQNAAAGYRANAAAPKAFAMDASGSRSSNDLALMAVGGAGLIVGALIGGTTGTIVMLGSGVIGLVGLFRYMQ